MKSQSVRHRLDRSLPPSLEYARTRAFYAALGFHQLVVLPELWDPANPCLLLVLPL